MILFIDNYDSFSFNIIHELARFDDIKVLQSNRATVEEVYDCDPKLIVVGPGPGRPENAGLSLDIFKCAIRRPIFGVCLGMQCFALARGAKVVHANQPVHGYGSEVFHGGRDLFSHIPSPFTAIRYHSLAVDAESLDEALCITAWTKDGTVMGIASIYEPIQAVQYHPESFSTAFRKVFFENVMAWSEKDFSTQIQSC